MSNDPPIQEALHVLHNILHGTDADIAYGKLRHIITEYEKLRAHPVPDPVSMDCREAFERETGLDRETGASPESAGG